VRRRPAPSSARSNSTGVGLVLLGALSIQFAATLAIGTFARLPVTAVSAWRFLPGAILLVLVVRPRLGRLDRRAWVGAFALGLSTSLMNLCFFQAIHRIPLGSAVAIEYLGPFFVAMVGRPSVRQLVPAVLAAGGVIALTRPGSGITWAGAGFAALAAVGWAAYTAASHRVGATTAGYEGLAVAMVIAALVTIGFAIPTMGTAVGHFSLLARLVGLSLLAVVVGFGAELQALRRLSPRVVAVLLAFDPAVAFLVAWVALGQRINGFDALGVALVAAAGTIVARSGAAPPEPTVLL
jgi:inner membrane transporter RhtA